MRNLDAPVAASHRAYAITIGLQDEHGNPITAVEVKFTGFTTLGELLTVLEVVRTSDALLQAQAEVMSSTQDEFAANLAGLVAKAAGQGELDFVEEDPYPRPDATNTGPNREQIKKALLEADPYYGLSTVRDENIAPTAGPTQEQIEKALLEAFPQYTGPDSIQFKRINSDGIEVDENGEPVPVDHEALLDSVLRQFADGRGDDSDRFFLEDGREVNAEGDVIEEGADGPVAR